MEKLTRWEKTGYALGDMAANFIFQAMLALQLSFYVDTYGLSAAAAGTMFLVVGLIVAFLNPVMGMIADRTNSRLGKFRPWLLWSALPFGILGVLTFTTPDISPTAKLVYAWVTYFLLRVIYVVNNVPYASLTAVMTADPDERTSISSYRQIAANAAGFVIASLAIPMVKLFGGGNDALGYQITMGILSLCSIVFFIIAFLATKERIQPDPGQKSSLSQDLSDLFGNRAWVVLFLATAFYFIATSMRGNVMLPYFKYVSGDETLFSWFNGFGLIALILGVMVSLFLSLKLGKRKLFIISMLITGVLNVALILIPPENAPMIIGCEVLRQFAYGWSGPLLWSMMGDVADYGEWKTGRRASGTVTAAVVFALWVGLALGSAIDGWLFSAYGYTSHAVQSSGAIFGIKITAALWSGLAFFATAATLAFYPLTHERNKNIAEELTERRKSYANIPL